VSICGTRPGYQRHQDENTRPCPPCLEANSAAVKASRVRTGKTQCLNVTVEVLAETLAAHPCEALRAFLGEEVARAVIRSPKARSAATR
jgi:hypothetical protein